MCRGTTEDRTKLYVYGEETSATSWVRPVRDLRRVASSCSGWSRPAPRRSTPIARLGHASEKFTASVYQHSLRGMDCEAAGTIAALFVRNDAEEAGVSKSVSKGDENGQSDDL
jgi:hypothetical protein